MNTLFQLSLLASLFTPALGSPAPEVQAYGISDYDTCALMFGPDAMGYQPCSSSSMKCCLAASGQDTEDLRWTCRPQNDCIPLGTFIQSIKYNAQTYVTEPQDMMFVNIPLIPNGN